VIQLGDEVGDIISMPEFKAITRWAILENRWNITLACFLV